MQKIDHILDHGRNSFCRGFSLVESLVTMLIFSVIVAGIYATALAGDSSWQANKVRIELQQELRKGMEWMIYDLRQSGDSSITNVPADDNWYTTITFRTPAGVTAGSLSWNLSTVQFALGGADSNQLQRIDGAGTKVIAQDIQSLQFRRQAATPNILEVAMTAQQNTIKGTPVDHQLNFEIQLRN